MRLEERYIICTERGKEQSEKRTVTIEVMVKNKRSRTIFISKIALNVGEEGCENVEKW